MRALRRAARDGHAKYEGQILYVRKDFVPIMSATITPAPKPKGPRLEVFSWSCLGLSEELYQELLC